MMRPCLFSRLLLSTPARLNSGRRGSGCGSSRLFSFAFDHRCASVFNASGVVVVLTCVVTGWSRCGGGGDDRGVE
jgi:hypothetical protein